MSNKEMRQIITVNYEKGLHVRVVAMIVQTAGELQKKYNIKYKIKIGSFNEVPLTSILLVSALKIKKNDQFELITVGEKAYEASIELKKYLEGNFNVEDKNINEVDHLLQENMIAAENIYNSIENGLIVIDGREIINVFNKEAEKLFEKTAEEVLGKSIKEIYPGLRLGKAFMNGQSENHYQDKIGKYNVMVKTAPILDNDEVQGIICVFEDISKLVKISWDLDEIKELKEKYLQILESVQDGICVFEQSGIITYVNKAYNEITSNSIMVGDDLKTISPKGNRMVVLKTGKKITGGISHKDNGVTIIANITPIIVDRKILGGISVIKNISEIEILMERINRLTAKAEYLEEELNRRQKLDSAFSHIIGNSSKLYDAIEVASKVARNNLNVLIRGESGTGKELIAEGIHYSSKRNDKPFIRVNCAAIPPNLLESEMFGHVKGAYTGAIKTKMGKFELANGGTIFLDEIGELDIGMQAKMLRVIQNKEFQRVGDEKTIKADIRILAATNRNLEEFVKNGKFREDLYYRLNVIPIWLPALRERKEDIPMLVEHFLNKIAKDFDMSPKYMSKDAMNTLLNYNWPGNIRELENLMERLFALTEGDEIIPSSLPNYICNNLFETSNQVKMYSQMDEIGQNYQGGQNYQYKKDVKIEKKDNVRDDIIEPNFNSDEEILQWEEYEKEIIKKALKRYKSFNAAAKALGISHKTVAAKARKYNIE